MGEIHQYPSDISREEYNLIREDLEGTKKTTRPRKYDLYDMFCAVLYVIQGGIQWRMLPSDYPKWQSVYHHFRVRSEKDETGGSVLDKYRRRPSSLLYSGSTISYSFSNSTAASTCRYR